MKRLFYPYQIIAGTIANREPGRGCEDAPVAPLADGEATAQAMCEIVKFPIACGYGAPGPAATRSRKLEKIP